MIDLNYKRIENVILYDRLFIDNNRICSSANIEFHTPLFCIRYNNFLKTTNRYKINEICK